MPSCRLSRAAFASPTTRSPLLTNRCIPALVCNHSRNGHPNRVAIHLALETSSRAALEIYIRSSSSGSDIELDRMNTLLQDRALPVPSVWLLFAARFGDADTVQTLLKDKVDPNVADTEGSTSLMRSASRGHTQVVSILLQAPGIDVQRKNDWGYDAVRYIESVRISKPEAYAQISALFATHGVTDS
eukprot:GFKZ01015093.1.p2 GENE.GFKZ01015093.1~~GFKZ01015093.1.p2  ORF type:complete len:187 (+),score=14.73 GFKZ01015093.1:376-936(+)